MYKIVIFTGSRADFYLLLPFAKELSKTNDVSWLVSGGHFLKEQGSTYEQIKTTNSLKMYCVDIAPDNKSNLTIAQTISTGVNKYSDFFFQNKFDLFIVLGDRYEAFAACLSANLIGVKILHLYGGEETIGANDNYFRNCMTKLSQLHACSCELYKKRVIQMGENPKYVWNIGAIGVNNVKNVEKLSKENVYEFLNIPYMSKFFLVTYHPETLTSRNIRISFSNFLRALSVFEKEFYFIFTGANADLGGAFINETLNSLVVSNDRYRFFYNLGLEKYINVARLASLVIGNSSSGVVELPSITSRIVDVGDRQKGRERANSVCHALDNFDDIVNTINECLSKPNIICENPYDKGDAVKNLKLKLDNIRLENISLQKPFFDLR